MYDALIRSTIFGVRNADKVVNTADKGRVAADVGQFTNAVKTAAQLDNAVGKGAQAAIGAMGKAAEKCKAIEVAGKGAQWAAKHVNPLLVGAAGYRVITADDKATALRNEVFGMSAMFGGEFLMKEFFKSGKMTKFREGINNKYLRIGLGVLEGALFVGGSILASNAGYNLSKKLYGDGKKPNQPKVETENLQALIKKEEAKLEKVKEQVEQESPVTTRAKA